MKLLTKFCAALVALGILGAAAPVAAQEKLVVWWVKGFYKSEDDALYEAIKKFETKTGIKVDLSQYAVQDGIPKLVSALDAGTPPDVAYIDVLDFQVTGKWAFDGKLEDISDIIVPIKGQFLPNTVETTYLLNSKTGKRLLRVPAQAADDAHPGVEGHARRDRRQGRGTADRVEGILELLVRQGAAGI